MLVAWPQWLDIMALMWKNKIMEKNTLRRALTYPYKIPKTGFAYLSGKAYPLVAQENSLSINGSALDDWLERKQIKIPQNWISIIAYGSNQSISHLYKKFPTNVPIIGIPVELRGFDVVRSAHFTSYGTIPATIIPSFGCYTRAFLLLLPQDQLAKMHRTEHNGVNYQFVTFPPDRLESPYQSEEVWVYTSLHGILKIDDSPIAFSEISSTNRTLPHLTQPELMKRVHKKLLPTADITLWLKEIVSDEVFRVGMSNALKGLE